MKELRLANKIIFTLLKDRMHYPGRFIVDTTAIVARCGVLLLLYSYVFSLKGGVIQGVPFRVAAWSMFFYFAFSSLRLRDLAKTIMQDVKSGAVETLFNKPIVYISYRAWWQIGSGLYSFLVISTFGSIALMYFIGPAYTMEASIFIPTLALTIFLGVTLSLLIYSSVGLFAFWIEDIRPIYWMIDKSVMILGGSYLPIALFPDFLYRVAIWSPFGASQFITHTVNKNWEAEWLQFIGIQFFWIFILGIATYFLFSRAKQKLSVNGG